MAFPVLVSINLHVASWESWWFSSRNGLIPHGIRLVVINTMPIVVVVQFSDSNEVKEENCPSSYKAVFWHKPAPED